MKTYWKSTIAQLAVVLVTLLILSNFSSAQETVVGNVAFFPTGSARSMQSNSSMSLGGHTFSCAQAPIWRDAEIQRGANPTIDVSSFGPCTIDGVLVRAIVLTEYAQGISLNIHLANGKCFSLMLTNSQGIKVTDLTEVGFKGNFKSNSIAGFNLIGTVN